LEWNKVAYSVQYRDQYTLEAPASIVNIFTAMSSRTDKHKYEQVVNKEGEGHSDDLRNSETFVTTSGDLHAFNPVIFFIG
jgi:hypothetical protein